MINNRQNGRRGRGRGPGGNGGPGPRQGGGGRPDNGNRIDNRARGNASQLHEKYKTLAADSQRQGDRVTTEYYLQFADHYFRVLSEQRGRMEEQQPRRQAEGFDEFDGNTSDEFGEEGEPVRADDQMRMREDEPRRQRNDGPRNEGQRGDNPRNDGPRNDGQRHDGQREEQPRQARGDEPRQRSDEAPRRARDDEPRRDRDQEPRRQYSDDRARGGEPPAYRDDQGARDEEPRRGRRRAVHADQADQLEQVVTSAPAEPAPGDVAPALEDRAQRAPANDEDGQVAVPRRRGRPPRIRVEGAEPVEPASEAAVFDADRLPPSLNIGVSGDEAEQKPRRRRRVLGASAAETSEAS